MTRDLLIALLLLTRAAAAEDQTPDFGPAIVLAPPAWVVAPLPSPARHRVLVVRDDPGGPIRPRLQQVAALRAAQVRVELRGRYCNSACTLLLGAGDVCVAPRTRFGFHGPHYLGRPMPAARFEHWSSRMAALYPPPLRRWFMTQARHAGTAALTLTGRQLIAMGFARC